MKSHVQPSSKQHNLATFVMQFAATASFQFTIFAVSLLVAMFCAVEGGYQLHLSHEHGALSCIQLDTPMVAGEQIQPLPERVDAPPCKAPDEPGQPWRLKLVLLDMFGFVIFGMLCFDKSRRLICGGD
ncbi:MAG: hypothetical protein ABSB70_23550 [Candidatus Velthaea sp.]